MTSQTAYDGLLDALEAHGSEVRRLTGRATAQCPGHDDTHASLSIKAGTDQALVFCHSGCATEDLLAVLNLQLRDLYDTPRQSWDYLTLDGLLERTVTRRPGRRFTQSGPKTGPVLLRAPEVIAGVAFGQTIYLVEGEKDADAVTAVGGVGTTGPQGARNFSKVDVTPLKGAQVVAVVDRDQAGDTWATQVREALDGVVDSLVFKQAATGKDASDHLAAGHELDDLVDYRPAPDKGQAKRRIKLTWAHTIAPAPARWAWIDDGKGRIPAGALTIAAGREGTGKSSFGIWATAQVTLGTLPGVFHGRPRKVFYLAIEDSWRHTIAPRLIAAGADMTLVARVDIVTATDDQVILNLPADLELLEASIGQEDAAVVVIDPLMSVLDEELDTHKTREVRQALDPLASVADRTGAVILGIAHFSKATGTDAASLISGSHAFRDVPRAIFGFIRDRDADPPIRVMEQIKNSLGRDDLPAWEYRIESTFIDTPEGVAETGRFTFVGETDRRIEDILRDQRKAPVGLGAAAWIEQYLVEHDGSADSAEVIKAGIAAGYAEGTIKNARMKVASTQKKEFGDGWLWMLFNNEGPGHQESDLRDLRGSTDPESAPQGHEGHEGHSSYARDLRWEPGGDNDDDDATRPLHGRGVCTDCGGPCPPSMVLCDDCHRDNLDTAFGQTSLFRRGHQ